MNLLLAPLVFTFLAMSMPANISSARTEESEQIRVVPVSRTPEPNTVSLVIEIPKNGEYVRKNPVWVQFRIDGYSLGSASQFDRADEIPVSQMGQTVHVVVDDRPYFSINEPAIDPFSEDGFYYDMSFKFEMPFRLNSGMHTIRAFPARSFGESLKGEKTFYSTVFYLGSEENDSNIDLSKPYITYNEPSDEIYHTEKMPVLLDFYLSNAELSQDGYKVRLIIDGKAKRTLTSWQPYYIYGLKRGKHTVRLELLNPQDQIVPGPYNDTQRTFTVH